MTGSLEYEPFSNPERMRRGLKKIRRERTLFLDCADRPRMVTFDALTGLVLRSTPIARIPEHGWEEEDPAEIGQAEEIPIRHDDRAWNGWDDPA